MDIAGNIMRNSAGRVSDDLPLRAILDASAFSDVYGARTYVMPSTGENILDIRLTVPFYPYFSLFLLSILYNFSSVSRTPLSSVQHLPLLCLFALLYYFHPYFFLPSFLSSTLTFLLSFLLPLFLTFLTCE